MLTVYLDEDGKDVKDAKRRRKKQKLHPSTTAEVLEKLAQFHPLPLLILEHRKLTHLLTHYIDILAKFAFYAEKHNMHRIFATILQTVVPTGRLAFTDPNLQAITHAVSFAPVEYCKYIEKSETSVPVVHEESLQTPVSKIGIFEKPPAKITVSVRDSFIPETGSIFFCADYSQLEVRIMAHISGDKDMIRLLNNKGDIFKQIASQWLDKPLEEISPEEREQAKHICYGILYGMGPNSLASELRVSVALASHFIETFKKRYPGYIFFLNFI